MSLPPQDPRQDSALPSRLGLREPVISAPMAGAAGGRLAAAVSAAGALGMVGVGGGQAADAVSGQCAEAGRAGQPWGVGFMAWALERDNAPLRAALDHGPALVSVSFGDPGPHLDAIHGAGALMAMQVGDESDLRRALELQVDVVVVRGGEGGGHGRNDVATLPLLQLALDATDRPVVAGGGIATARGVAAALAAGASAVWVGTRFAACAESAFAETAKAAVAEAGVGSTVYTRAFDVAQRLPWPPEFGGRALGNRFTDEWAARTEELERGIGERPDLTRAVEEARAAGDTSLAPVYAGQSAGLARGGETAADVVADLAGFRRHLAAAADRWGRAG